MRKRRPTLKDLAAVTGLSPTGVHYALRGERASPETVARVHAAAKQIGFRLDPVARALRGGSSGLVGVLGGSLDDYWHQHFAAELGRELAADGRRMLLADAAGDHDRQIEIASALLDHRVDGLVVLPVDGGSADWSPIAEQVPTVLVGAASRPPAGAVRFDVDGGVRLVVDHLRELGHREVILLAPGAHMLTPIAGVTIVECGFSMADARVVATAALTATPQPTAIFGLSDAIACGVYAACADLGIRIPDDVSVAGFDDHPLSTLLAPALTTVGWDTPRVAASAARILNHVFLDGGKPVSVDFPPELVPRQSTARRPAD